MAEVEIVIRCGGRMGMNVRKGGRTDPPLRIRQLMIFIEWGTCGANFLLLVHYRGER